MDNSVSRLTADSFADFDKFTDILLELTKQLYGEDLVFSESSPIGDDPENHVLPHITFLLVERKRADKTGVKQQAFGYYPDPNHEGETISIFKKWFTCIVDFDVHARTNEEARKWSNEFEDMIDRYKGHIKNSGVSEMTFISDVAEKYPTSSKQRIAKRTLSYEVRIEKTMEVRSVELRRIEGSVKTLGGDAIKVEIPAEHKALNAGLSIQDLYNQSFKKKEEQ